MMLVRTSGSFKLTSQSRYMRDGVEHGTAIFEDVLSLEAREDGDYPDMYDTGQQLNLPLDRWQAMGEPRVITVTVEPGDTLNL